MLLLRLHTLGGTQNELVASLADVSHVGVDGRHERSLDTDFSLVLPKDVPAKRKDLKVAFFSATLDASVFKSYFGGKGDLVEIEGRAFPVQDSYLDVIMRLTGSKVGVGKNSMPEIDADGSDRDPAVPGTI